jgi:hypothetical protein
MLGTPDRKDSFFIVPGLHGCYVADINKPELTNKIFLVYDYEMTTRFVKFERSLELHPYYVRDYDYPEEKQVVFVFDVPEEFTKDYNLFKEGSYSQFSEEYKQQILRFWGIKKENNIIHGVLYVTDFIKDYWAGDDEDKKTFTEFEFWPKPVMLEETYMLPG